MEKAYLKLKFQIANTGANPYNRCLPAGQLKTNLGIELT